MTKLERDRFERDKARLAKLIDADPFRTVPVALPMRTAKRKRRLTERELSAMGLEVAREYLRTYGEESSPCKA